MEKTKFVKPLVEAIDAALEEKPKRAQRCETCRFMDRDEDGLICRRNPPRPTVLLVAGPHGPQPIGTLSSFPPVGLETWCGEWQPKLTFAQ